LPVLFAAGAVFAQTSAPVQVDGAWMRPAVQGQHGTGAYMTLTAPTATQLVGVSSPVAGVAQVHEMKMEGDVMRMRALTVLDLPAGKPVQLKPGSFHLMLMDLKAPVTQGAKVPLTLSFKDANGVQSKLDVQVPVATRAPGEKAQKAAGHSHGHHH
jgi:periplasmic copper chaperone A